MNLGHYRHQHPLSFQHRLIIFLIVPLCIGSIMMGLQFSGQPALSALIAPKIDGIGSFSYREFGILENIQHLYLIIAGAIAGYGIKTYPFAWQKTLMCVVMCGFIFLFLEEIDYGRHYYDIWVKPEEFAADRNVHNRKGLNRLFKVTADIATVIWFVLIPILLRSSDSVIKRMFVPDKWYLIPLVIMVLQSKFSRYLDAKGFGPDVDLLLGNISEFKELGLYYVWMVFLIDIVLWRRQKA